MTIIPLGMHGEEATVIGNGREYGYAQVVVSLSGGEACIRTQLTLDITEARYLATALLLEADRAAGDQHPQIETQYCSKCKEKQFITYSGLSCPNGHGGAPSVELP